MSASLPSLFPETALAARPAPPARAVRQPAREDEGFTAHLRDDSTRRAVSRTPAVARRPTPAAEQPVGDRRSEAPAKPATAARDMRDTPARPPASDRARERASERASFKREAEAAPVAPTEPGETPAEPTEPTAIANASAEKTATDAALTIETALSSAPSATDEADAAAEKNDSAMAAETGLVPVLAAPVPAVPQVAPEAAATAKDAGETPTTVQGVLPHAASRAAAPTDTIGLKPAETPATDQAPAPAGPAVPHAQHSLFAQGLKSAVPESGEPGAKAHAEAATIAAAEAPGLKTHGAPAGLQLHLQPTAPDLTPQTDRGLPPQAPAPQTPPVPLQAVPLTIGLKALEGAREFEIRLDPAELGRVDVKLSISEDGRVQASLVVDRVETLALLQRDARTLERAFDQAGLTTDANAIQFSLRQDGGGEQSRRERFDDSGAAALSGMTELSPAQERPAQLYRGFVRETGVDIRV